MNLMNNWMNSPIATEFQLSFHMSLDLLCDLGGHDFLLVMVICILRAPLVDLGGGVLIYI